MRPNLLDGIAVTVIIQVITLLARDANTMNDQQSNGGAESSGFDAWTFSAELNFTQHIGGATSTKMLIEGCQIRPGHHVLEVGCGVGKTRRFRQAPSLKS